MNLLCIIDVLMFILVLWNLADIVVHRYVPFFVRNVKR